MCHSLSLRPSLWAVVFNSLQQLGESWSWRQDDPTSATVQEVILEIQKATDQAIFRGCILIGQVSHLALEVVPDYFLVCDGSTYNRVDYPELYAVISVEYHIDADTFRVPNLIDRVARGGFVPAIQGGADEVTLTSLELPAHDHNYEKITPTVALAGELGGIIVAEDVNTEPTGTAGGGEPFSIIPSYETLIPVIMATYPTAG